MAPTTVLRFNLFCGLTALFSAHTNLKPSLKASPAGLVTWLCTLSATAAFVMQSSSEPYLGPGKFTVAGLDRSVHHLLLMLLLIKLLYLPMGSPWPDGKTIVGIHQ